MLSRLSKSAPWLLLALAGSWAPGAMADVPAVKSPPPLADVQREAALKFAKEHHPQLNSLIRRLKERDAAEYERALADVSKTCERLARLKPRDPERYEVDLALWRFDSRIRLLAARMASSDQASLENQLRSLLNERTDLRIQQLALERARLSSRIEKLDEQTAQLSANREAQITKEVERLRKSVRNRTPAAKQRPKARQSPERTPPQRPGKDSPEFSSAPAPKSKP